MHALLQMQGGQTCRSTIFLPKVSILKSASLGAAVKAEWHHYYFEITKPSRLDCLQGNQQSLGAP